MNEREVISRVNHPVQVRTSNPILKHEPAVIFVNTNCVWTAWVPGEK